MSKFNTNSTRKYRGGEMFVASGIKKRKSKKSRKSRKSRKFKKSKI